MPKVLYECPKSGDSVWTGIVMDESTFESAEFDHEKFACRSCGQDHGFTEEEVWLGEV